MKELSIVEDTIKDRVEVDILEQRKEIQEGSQADKKIGEIQTKEEIRRKEIGDKYLGGVLYERERVIGEVKAYLQQTVIGIIEAGKRLIAMKEAEKHGEWMKIVEERLGIGIATAWRFMAITKKLQIFHAVKNLTVTYTNGIGKLYALLNVPDEELAEFDETGLLKGASIEEINKMSVSQFRKLIAEKEDWKAKAKQLELEVQGKYDTTTRYKKHIEKLEKENKGLKHELEQAKKPLPEDAARAIDVLAKHRDDALAIYYFLHRSDPEGYPEIVRADLLNTAYFLSDLFTLLAHNISNKYDIERPYPTPLLEDEERSFNKKYKNYLDIELPEGVA